MAYLYKEFMRKIFTNITVLVISFLVCIFVLEVMLRTFFPVYLAGHIGAYQYDEVLGVRLKKNIRYSRTTDHYQEIHTNSIGTINLQESFSDYDKLVFAIGDSFTQGTGLPVDASYPFQLSLMLNMKNDTYLKDYGIVNLGLAAYGMEQAILAAKMYQKVLGSPDYILYLGCSNDYSDDLLFQSGYRHRHLVEGNPYWGIFLKPLQWFTNDTEIGKRAKLILGSFRREFYKGQKTAAQLVENKDGINKAQSNAHVDAGTSKPGSISIAEQQESRFNKLLSVSREMNAQLVVSWTALPESGDSNSYSWLKQWAGKNNVAFADWHPRLNSVLRSTPNMPINNPYSSGHYRTWVNNIIAESYSRHIQH